MGLKWKKFLSTVFPSGLSILKEADLIYKDAVCKRKQQLNALEFNFWSDLCLIKILVLLHKLFLKNQKKADGFLIFYDLSIKCKPFYVRCFLQVYRYSKKQTWFTRIPFVRENYN